MNRRVRENEPITSALLEHCTLQKALTLTASAINGANEEADGMVREVSTLS